MSDGGTKVDAARVLVAEDEVMLPKLRKRVLAHLDRSDEHDGSPFSMADYLQLASMGRHSVELRLARAGRPVGRVRVRRGTVWSAEADGLTGDDAVRAVAFAEGWRSMCARWSISTGRGTSTGSCTCC